jgi:microcystin-dependent protein
MAGDKVQIIPVITPDDRTVDIKVKYSGPGHSVKLQDVKHENFTCSLSSSAGRSVQPPVYLGTDLINVNCLRANPHPATLPGDATQYSELDRGTITVQTAGETLQLYFSPQWDPELPVSDAKKIRAELAVLSLAAPPGTIIAYAGDTLPSGWLWCDGSVVSRSGQYADLFKAIHETYGNGDGTTTFKLPDLRGIFIRGLDRGGSSVDKDRIDAHQGLGSSQGDQFASHYHSANRSKIGEVCGGCEHQDAMIDANNPDQQSLKWTNTPAGKTRTDFQGGTETRPKNIALNYIIKY